MVKNVKVEILGKSKGRKVAVEGSSKVHRSQWMPDRHPGTCEVPYILHPTSVKLFENMEIRRIWDSSDYSGKDFSPFEVTDVPNKFRLAQVLACGLKAACATYSQHWEGMYFDWTFNDKCQTAISKFGVMANNERFVKNAFATVVLISTGYSGGFMDILRLRHKPIVPSMNSLENIDMGTFEHNLKSAIGAVLGGHIGVNVIKQSLAKSLIEGPNLEGYEALKNLAVVPGMNKQGRITTIIQIGFKQAGDREEFDPALMKVAGAKLVERKSERRNSDFSRDVPAQVMSRFFISFNRSLKRFRLQNVVKTIVLDSTTSRGRGILNGIRQRIYDGVEKCREDVLNAYEDNLKDGVLDTPGLSQFKEVKQYKEFTEAIRDIAQKVLKPREDGHRMVFVYIDMRALRDSGISIDVAEQAAGDAIQAGLNSIHLDGTTNIPEDEDLRYGAFCMTGPIHACELLDDDDQLTRGWGHGFWDIIASGIPSTNKMVAIISICAKHEQDALIAERQAMEQRKSVNDIFWYRTWNHPEGKKLDIPHWISYADILNVLPIPGNDVLPRDKDLPEFMPSEHPITKSFLKNR